MTTRALHWGPVLTEEDPPLQTLATESGLRSRPAAEVREHLTPHLWDYGITRVAHLTGFDRVGIPVHMAVKPQGRSLSSGSGKGVTPEASWVSAVMECCEQAVWEHLDLDRVEASQNILRRAGVVTVDGRDCPPLRGSLWHEDQPTVWTPAWDILNGEEVWMPDILATLTPPDDFRIRPFVSGTNGLASGMHVLEAVLSGLLEVVERDGLSLWSGDRRRILNPWPLLRETAPDIADKLRRAGLQPRVVDATTEIGVPTVVAYLHDAPGGTTGSFKGAGAALTTEVALVRAITEAIQARCLIVAGARDDIFETMRSSATSAPAAAHTPPAEELRARPTHSTGSVEGDIEWIASRLQRAGFDRLLVLRHTRPDEPVQVVRVFVPGLEGYPFSYAAPGRRAQTWTPQLVEAGV